MPFFAFTGEGKRGEAFTCKSLMHSFLRPYGEEVKANNEKRRTRARWGGVGTEGAEVGDGVESMIERPDRTQEKKDFR